MSEEANFTALAKILLVFFVLRVAWLSDGRMQDTPFPIGLPMPAGACRVHSLRGI